MAFHDGLGERRVSRDSGGDLEHLRLRHELSSVPSFEFALRERATRLAQFRHPAFARVRSIERGSGADPGLSIVSEHTQGCRLAEVIAEADAKGLPLDLGASLYLLRQLIPAIAILHEAARDVAHGAIAVERLIVTRASRLVVTDYVLGSALEQLLYSRDRYWTELRIPLPRAAGLARLDQQADVLQIGAVALSLVLGRRLREDDSSSRLSELLAVAKARMPDGTSEPLPEAFKQWLQRALHLDPRAAFPSAVEARLAFDRVIDESPCDVSPASLDALLSRLGGEPEAQAGAADTPKAPARAAIVDFKAMADARAVAAAVPERVAAPLAFGASAAAAATAPALAPAMPAPLVAAVVAAPVAMPVAAAVTMPAVTPSPSPMIEASAPPVPVHTSPMFGSIPSGDGDTIVAAPRARSTSMMVAFGIVAVAVAGVIATVAWPRTPKAPVVAPVTTGTLAVTTDPSGAQIAIDGAAQGIAPLTLTLAAGSHTLVVRGEFGERSVPVTVGAGAQVAQYLDLPKAAPVAEIAPSAAPAVTPAVAPNTADAPLAGWVAVQSRFEVQLFEGGQLLGSSQSDRIMIGAGRHDLELVNEALGYRSTRAVQVAAGKVAALAVDAPTGTIALNALPWADVFIDGEKVGETPLGNVSLPIGEHDVVFRHPDLGEQRYKVALTLKAPARLSADLRKR